MVELLLNPYQGLKIDSTQPYNLHPLTLHPEVIAFFDLKTQNNNCNLPT
jgi:hypothetical protein